MINLINAALAKGAKVFPNVSGGKDGQAMTLALHKNGIPITGLIHADLGQIEWHQSLEMCQQVAAQVNAPLHIVKRKDGKGLLELMQRRMETMQGTGKPFWPSSSARYCTSDTKRDPIHVFYRNLPHDFIISCVGIRAAESNKRSKMLPYSIETRCSSSFYKGMTVEQAIENFTPGKRLVIQVFPIFNFTTGEVWASGGNSSQDLITARAIYQTTGQVPAFWNFHPAYVFGNERVSCVFCVLGGCGDLVNGAAHRPELLQRLIDMETASGFTFKKDFALTSLL